MNGRHVGVDATRISPRRGMGVVADDGAAGSSQTGLGCVVTGALAGRQPPQAAFGLAFLNCCCWSLVAADVTSAAAPHLSYSRA